METFEELKEICRRACHERNACKEGFEAMLLAENTAELMHVWRRWWEDVWESKYADIMTERIATARGRLRREMRQSDVFVNESSERGLVIVCRPDRPIRVGGRAKCYVFGTAADVTATDHAQVYCRESGVRLTLRGYATGRVKAGDCRCYDRTLLKGTLDTLRFIPKRRERNSNVVKAHIVLILKLRGNEENHLFSVPVTTRFDCNGTC